jgi:hypothetical protein
MRSSLLALACALACALPTPAHALDDTLIWIGMRGGMGFYNDTDPDPLEELATRLSVGRQTFEVTDDVEFYDKEWGIPFDVRVGFTVTETINAWFFYERLPYLLEADAPDRFATPGSNKTVSLNIPANVFGAGFDFRLGSEGYGNSLLLGFGAGRFESRGDDEDFSGLSNFEVAGSGVFWEVQAMAELEFTTELSFLPFVAFRSAVTRETSVAVNPRQDARPVPPGDIPEFEIDYTGVTVGMSVRFRVYPFDIIGDPDLSGDDD